jgi:hypothetical protein
MYTRKMVFALVLGLFFIHGRAGCKRGAEAGFDQRGPAEATRCLSADFFHQRA